MPEQLDRGNSATLDSPAIFATSLPPQIVERIAERICLITVIVASTTVAMVGLGYFLQPEFAAALQQPSLRLTCLGMVFLSAALFFVQKTGWFTKARMLDLALVYQVFVSFAIGMLETAMASDNDGPVRGLTYLGLWFFVNAFMLPNAPLRMAVAALFSILGWLGAYWINIQVNGVPHFPRNRLAFLVGQMVVTAVWMLVINRASVRMYLKQEHAEQLGSYHLESIIGKGGMGEVWKAKHKLLARDAAIKLIRPDVLRASTGREEAALRKRFEREAKVTAHLRSPNTVALYDFGITRDGTIYYVMELLNGIDLQTLVERFGPLPPGRVQNTLIQICESLEEAHRAGLVHRDIKPKNIILSKLGLQYDFAKVLDFGLVRVPRQSDMSSVTVEGITAGTPAYLAPEVALAQEDIDGRADLYSLGCVGYFLLTGCTVFDEPSAVAHAIAHLHSPVVPPSQRTELPIPPGLEQIVLRLLEKKAENRIQSAYELARILRGLTGVTEFCPYTAAEWWTTNLPETLTSTTLGDEAVRSLQSSSLENARSTALRG